MTEHSTEKKLYGEASNGISLYDAISNVKEQLSGSIGLFYSPKACSVGRLEKDEQGQIVVRTLRRQRKKWTPVALKLSPIFEARLFSKTAELSWLNTPGEPGGQAVLVTETKPANDSMTIEAYDCINQQYAVWGEYDTDTEQDIPEDWTIVSTSQIGKLALPIASKERKDFVVLATQEYLRTDEDGNAYVKYERLLNLSWKRKDK